MFKASSIPVQKNFSPPKYLDLGQEYPRGDARRIMSRSELCRFGQLPRKWLLGGFDKSASSSMIHGSLVDCLLLTPDFYEECYSVTPETYPTEVMKCPQCGSITDSKVCRKCKVDREKVTVDKPWTLASEYCKEWEQQIALDRRTPIQSVQLNTANAAIRRLKEDLDILNLISNSDFQVFIQVDWHDSATGLVIPVKCLIDIVPHKESFLADLKTTKDAEPRAYSRQIFENGLHVQAALYLDAHTAATNEFRQEFRHIVSENETPFETAKRWISEEFIELGRKTYQGLLTQYCQCLANNYFPGYDEWNPETSINGWGCASPAPYMILSE
jgi:hypothetical protein